MSSITKGEERLRWDLSDLYPSREHPSFQSTLRDIKERAERFFSRYHGKIANPDVDSGTLFSAITEYEGLTCAMAKPLAYAHLVFSENTADPSAGAFLQETMEWASSVQVHLLFFELEIQSLPEGSLRSLLEDPRLAPYARWILRVRLFTPYRLSEVEETLLERVSNTGVRAWVRLFEETLSAHEFEYKDPVTGERTLLSLEALLDLLRSPDRAVRASASDALTGGLKKLERLLTFIFNTLLLDKKIEDEIRGYQFPEQSRHLGNELDAETVEMVVRLCEEHQELVSRYYHVKREILGLRELTHIDRYAPLWGTVEHISFDRGREIVLEAFEQFSPVLASHAKRFFDERWIDAELRPGKAPGAFCHPVSPEVHPYILMSYQNKPDDVMTLAHELGHGVHFCLSAQQSYLNYHPTLPIGELASTFAEMLVFDRLQRNASVRDRLALYAEKIENLFATIFRQAAMFRFEQKCHRLRREHGELTSQEIGDIWQGEIQRMFGDSLILGPEHSSWWSYVGHFIFAPFYVYAYSFGELLVLCLFERAKCEDGFQEQYLRLLRAGGSLSPGDLLASVGIDQKDESFWRGGFRVMESLISEFEELWAQIHREGA
ncbi:MAG: M3 family oligoendopeptidase [Candidatus Caldarchaeum sp.]